MTSDTRGYVPDSPPIPSGLLLTLRRDGRQCSLMHAFEDMAVLSQLPAFPALPDRLMGRDRPDIDTMQKNPSTPPPGAIPRAGPEAFR